MVPKMSRRHGRLLAKRFVTRQKLSVPASASYWVDSLFTPPLAGGVFMDVVRITACRDDNRMVALLIAAQGSPQDAAYVARRDASM